MNRRRKYRFYRPARFAPFMLLALAFFSLLVMLLWNALIPSIFGLPTISFLQAAGLLILSRILFGGFPGGRHRHRKSRQWRARMAEKWDRMTPEEREQFKAGLRHWCGKGSPEKNKPDEEELV